MTEGTLEENVEAVLLVLARTGFDSEPMGRGWVEKLAPRVAAAIRAAHGSQGWKARAILQQQALEALRGDPLPWYPV